MERAVRAAVPGFEVALWVLPPDGKSPIQAIQADGGKISSPDSALTLDPYTGRLLASDLHSKAPAGDWLLRWFGPLHFGVFGGLPVKILWLLAGVILPVLSLTGLLMWWNRSAGKWVRARVAARQG